MKTKLFVSVFIFVFMSTYSSQAVKIYQWKDKSGVLHVVDDPDKVPREYSGSVEVIDTEGGSLGTEAKRFLPQLKSNGGVIAAGLVILVLIFVYIKSARRLNARAKKRQTERLSKAYELSGADRMDRAEFKRYVIGLLKQRGYKAMIASETMSAAVDLIAEKGGLKYAVRVHTEKNDISRVVVNDLDREKTRFGCSYAMIISPRPSDDGAKRLASSVGCSLVDRDRLARWIYDSGNKPRTTT